MIFVMCVVDRGACYAHARRLGDGLEAGNIYLVSVMRDRRVFRATAAA